MKKKSNFFKLFKRDDILINNILAAGFLAFFVTIIVSSAEIIAGLLYNELTFLEVKPALTFIGTGLLVFLGTVFMLTIAQKDHFNKRSILLVSFLVSIYLAIRLYMDGLESWVFFIVWILLSCLVYKVIKYLFEDISKNFFK